jgi:hypothetical protein
MTRNVISVRALGACTTQPVLPVNPSCCTCCHRSQDIQRQLGLCHRAAAVDQVGCCWRSQLPRCSNPRCSGRAPQPPAAAAGVCGPRALLWMVPRCRQLRPARMYGTSQCADRPAPAELSCRCTDTAPRRPCSGKVAEGPCGLPLASPPAAPPRFGLHALRGLHLGQRVCWAQPACRRPPAGRSCAQTATLCPRTRPRRARPLAPRRSRPRPAARRRALCTSPP